MHVLLGMKKLVQLKFVQLLLLYRVKGKMMKKLRCSRFLLHKLVQLKYFWTQFKNVHLQGPCSLRPCILRPYCNWQHSRNLFSVIILIIKGSTLLIFIRVIKIPYFFSNLSIWQNFFIESNKVARSKKGSVCAVG